MRDIGSVERNREQLRRERSGDKERAQMNDEVWSCSNAPASDCCSTVPARDERLSKDEELQAWVLAECDTRHALPRCFSHSPYQADVCSERLRLNRYLVVGQWTAPWVNLCFTSSDGWQMLNQSIFKSIRVWVIFPLINAVKASRCRKSQKEN